MLEKRWLTTTEYPLCSTSMYGEDRSIWRKGILFLLLGGWLVVCPVSSAADDEQHPWWENNPEYIVIDHDTVW